MIRKSLTADMHTATFRIATPDDVDWIVTRHQQLYTQDEKFDATFGPLVRDILIAFFAGHDPSCERGWIVETEGQPVGCIFCVRHDASTAKLRLFLLLPQARGAGLGQQLLDTCMGFARSSGYAGMTLWTHESHRAACALYAKNGWSLLNSTPVHSFGQDLVEQIWTIRF